MLREVTTDLSGPESFRTWIDSALVVSVWVVSANFGGSFWPEFFEVPLLGMNNNKSDCSHLSHCTGQKQTARCAGLFRHSLCALCGKAP